MGLFDFLNKNKNIITDNGLNKIYYDDGKGPIKEEFSKIKGVLNGEYSEFSRNGTFELKTYKDGVICLTDEQILENKRQEEEHKKIGIEIEKLSDLDKLISEITGIHPLVQMENYTIDSFAKVIENKLNKQFDEEYIKFYLYNKRNYFIKKLIEFGENKDLNIWFTEGILNYIRSQTKTYAKINHSEASFVEHSILHKLFFDNNTNSWLIWEININGDSNVYRKIIFNQQSILFGLNFNTFKLIHDKIKIKSKEYNSEDETFKIDTSDFFERLLNGDELDPRTHVQKDILVQKVIDEIETLCNENKFNQNDIIFPN